MARVLIGAHRGEAEALATLEAARQNYLRDLFQDCTLDYKPTIFGLVKDAVKAKVKKLLHSAATEKPKDKKEPSIRQAIPRRKDMPLRQGFNLAKQTAKAGKGALQPGIDALTSMIPTHEVIETLRHLMGLADLPKQLFMSMVSQILPEIIQDFAKVLGAVTPFLGTGLTGIRAVKSWATTVHVEYKTERMRRLKNKLKDEAVLFRDAQSAVDAIYRILKRERNANAIASARLTGQFAGQLTCDILTAVEVGTTPVSFGGTAILVGPTALASAGVGLAGSFLELSQTLFLIGRDCYERYRANKRLARPQELDATVFGECPLLGCYLILCGGTSMLMNFDFHEMGKPDWKTKVETERKKWQQVEVFASKITAASRFRVVGKNFTGKTDTGLPTVTKASVLHGNSWRKPFQDLKRLKSHFSRLFKHKLKGGKGVDAKAETDFAVQRTLNTGRIGEIIGLIEWYEASHSS